ncbi:MAG TPA: SDR family oxidoreductase [Acidimicrobiales bacterium]|nr:SDR family oxidoreductase [Acidimicrobiales bacterium]
MTGRINGKVAVITGGASGIGLGIARRFVAEGASVVLGDVNDAALDAAVTELGDAAAGLHTDVMDESSVAAMCAHAVERHGRLDIGVNAAGLGAYSPVVEQDTTTWDIVMGVNLRGVMLSMKYEARAMIEVGNGGSIINIASLNAVQPAEGMGLYCATKAAVDMYSKCAAMELGPHGIRVNSIGPGLVDTPLAAVLNQTPAIKAAFVENAPLGRTGVPDDVAGVALFLASDDASLITGDLLKVDGGAHTKRYPELAKILSAEG